MSQLEVYNILKSNPTKWFSSNDLLKKISKSRSSLNRNINRLEKSNFIKVKRVRMGKPLSVKLRCKN